MKILIIEDEVLLAASLKELLESSGFQATCVYKGTDGLAQALSGSYDLLILDIMLPDLDGFHIARELRRKNCSFPILMLTAKSDLEDRINGLDSGADYYLPKPFDVRELLSCVNALLRRQGEPVNELSYGNTILDLASNMLVCGDQTVRLSAKEFEVMHLLMQHQQKNLPKETILAKVWGYDNAGSGENHVEVYMGFLRKKLQSIGSNLRIEAARRLGYHLEVEQTC